MSSKAPPRKRARVGLPPSRLSRLSPRPVSSARSLINRFPNELWAVILASCSVADLCCLRATHEHLRALIDEKNSKLLKEAFKRSGLPSFQSIVARWPDVDLTRIPRRYQSTGEDEAVAYILMMCGGWCTVCGRWSGAPPFSSDLSVRLCGSGDCTSLMFSNLFSHRAGGSEDNDSTLPTEASYWLPYLHVIGPTATPPSRGRCVWYAMWPYLERRDCRYLLSRIRFAFDELASINVDCSARDDSPAWSLGTLPRSIDIDNLLEDYDERAVTHEAIETVYLAIAEWRQQNQLESAPIREANLSTLRDVVTGLHMDLGLIRNDPSIQRILAAHARDLALVSTTTFLHLKPKLQGQESGTAEIVELESDVENAIARDSESSDDDVGTSKGASSRAMARKSKLDRKISPRRKLAHTRQACALCRTRVLFTSKADYERHMAKRYASSLCFSLATLTSTIQAWGIVFKFVILE
ncbi:hypothetical protein EV122DRAFT_210199 [Schizophyllum commune]